jgi:hypothetical protein
MWHEGKNSMDNIQEEHHGFVITCPAKRVLGTIFELYATIKNKPDRPDLERLLKKKSGDLVAGNTPQETIENAKRYIDALLERDPAVE